MTIGSILGVDNPSPSLAGLVQQPCWPALNVANQTVSNLLKLMLDMKHVAVAGHLWHRRFLPRSQATAAISKRKSLGQSLAPSHPVDDSLRCLRPGDRQLATEAIAGCGINAHQHRLIGLIYLILKAHLNA